MDLLAYPKVPAVGTRLTRGWGEEGSSSHWSSKWVTIKPTRTGIRTILTTVTIISWCSLYSNNTNNIINNKNYYYKFTFPTGSICPVIVLESATMSTKMSPFYCKMIKVQLLDCGTLNSVLSLSDTPDQVPEVQPFSRLTLLTVEISSILSVVG